MTGMTTFQAQHHLAACCQMLDRANEAKIKDQAAAKAISDLIIAIEQLAEVVEDLANREQGEVIA